MKPKINHEYLAHTEPIRRELAIHDFDLEIAA